MNRNSGNASKTKKLISGAGNNSKPNRKSFQNASESSSISSNRNSSAQSEEDVRVGVVAMRPQANANPSHEEQEQVVKKLQGQVKELRHKLRVLEESVDSKDYSLGTIAREKDRAVGEIRRLERSNKQLRQQLSDERSHYLEEKEKFVEEMSKYKKRLQELKASEEGKKTEGQSTQKLPASKQSLISQSLRWHLNNEKGDFLSELRPKVQAKRSKSQRLPVPEDHRSSLLGSLTCSETQFRKAESLESFHLYEGDDLALQTAALRTENAKLRSIICERDARNYELCLRFLRMKHYKNDIRSRFQDLENEYLQVIANLMDKIDEARQEFNFIIDQKFKRPLHSTNAMYLQLVQRNSRMAFENASLRLENQCLKKELNKHVSNSADRKIDPATAEDGEGNPTTEESKADGKLKRIKKNVNFKEIRTIYERELGFKNSDTDSNYMSKTSTTVPSNGSLNDPKSKETVVDCEEETADPENKVQPCFQADTLPSEILNRIFKRIDTSSCQTLDSGRSKVQNNSQVQIKDVTSVEIKQKQSSAPEEEIQCRQSQTSEKKKSKEDSSRKLQKDSSPVVVEISPPKMTDSSSPCESKESVRLEAEEIVYSSFRPQKAETGPKEVPRRQGKPETRTFRHRAKCHARDSTYYDKDSGDGSSSLEFPVRKTDLFGRNLERTSEDAFQVRAGIRKQIMDSCGLQEKLEVSDRELPLVMTDEGKTQTDGETFETSDGPEGKQKEVRLSEDEEPGRTATRRRLHSGGLALRSRSRSNNTLSLHEELMRAEAEEPFWRRDRRYRSTFQKKSSESFRTDKESVFSQEFQSGSKRHLDREATATRPESGTAHTRKPEGSKRFSQRLISTSPEQLRNILTESQLGTCYRMAPIIVGHATTEINPGFQYPDSNNEIVLQLVIPTTTSVPQTPHVFAEEEAPQRGKLEKETSMSGLTRLSRKNLLAETRTSDVQIPISSLQTSTSTMDVVEGGAGSGDRNNIMLRTLSAPGLLESCWLDPYTICEMRDCSTNT